ncbi:MAG TPA: metallophosphoesterase [Candidatus Eisenbacteria bacterium]|nr:metallophosphoesterase [Candidatus Eisenbacteria bacterium]
MNRAALAHEDVAVPIDRLSQSIAANPGDATLWLARGEYRRIQGDLAGARADYDEAAKRQPSLPGLALGRASLALDAGVPREARRLLDAALEQHPGDPEALLLRSRALIALRERQAAIADLSALIAAAPRPDPDLCLERARLQVYAGDRDAALRGLDEARAKLGAIPSLELYAIDLELAADRPVQARERLDVLASTLTDPTPLEGVRARVEAAGGGTATASPVPVPEADAEVQSSNAAPVSNGTPSPLLAPTLTRGPYLQMGNHTAVTLRWRTGTASDSRVLYGTSPGNLTSSESDTSVTTEHVVRITGLDPDTRYYYAVATSTEIVAGDNSYTFVTAPVPGTVKPTRAWILGDSGMPTSNAFAVRNAYLAWTGSRGTDLWLMLGDNAYGSGTDSEYQVAVFNQYPVTLRQAVLWPTRGNHDNVHNGANNDYFDIFTLPSAAEAGGVGSGTEAYYSFDWANVHFICLDSQGSSRTPGSAMLTWLSNDLAANSQPWIVAYWHHPPYSKGSHDSDSESVLEEMREYALPILEAGGVDLVLGGHSHSYERSHLMNGHYGHSSTLLPSMTLNAGDGREDGDGPYQKPQGVNLANQGSVYAVAGSSCQIGGGSLNHPVMVTSFNLWGSMVLDVDGDRLEARFLNHTGVVLDSFTVIKQGTTGVGSGPGRTSLRLGPGLPNPFTRDLRISYTLEREGEVRLSIHDASGRRVAIADQGRRSAGTHEARWDGRDALGRQVPNGVYLAVLEAGGERISRKIAHVR